MLTVDVAYKREIDLHRILMEQINQCLKAIRLLETKINLLVAENFNSPRPAVEKVHSHVEIGYEKSGTRCIDCGGILVHGEGWAVCYLCGYKKYE